MKIVVDSLGGDFAPNEIIDGVVQALAQDASLEVVITGIQNDILSQLIIQGADLKRVEVIDAGDKIDNNESPTVAIRTKNNSSLVRAFDLLKSRDDIGALVSAGSTGAILAGAFMKIGRIPGISRPALAPLLPTANNGKVLLVDVGANMDCKGENLLHFAIMGNEYMKVMGIENPRIALLNVGTEESKGNELTKETFELLKNAKLNFIGNIEAREVLSGNVDVVIGDGFVCNILLKAVEGTAKFVLGELKKSIKSHFFSKIGAIFMKKTFKEMKAKMDYAQFGGAPFLGVKKLVLKAHGDSKANTIKITILQAKSLMEKDLIDKIGSVVVNESEV